MIRTDLSQFFGRLKYIFGVVSLIKQLPVFTANTFYWLLKNLYIILYKISFIFAKSKKIFSFLPFNSWQSWKQNLINLLDKKGFFRKNGQKSKVVFNKNQVKTIKQFAFPKLKKVLISLFILFQNGKKHLQFTWFKKPLSKLFFSLNIFFYTFSKLQQQLKDFLKTTFSFKFIADKKNKLKRIRRPFTLVLRLIMAVFILCLVSFGGLFYFIILKDLPNPNELINRQQAMSTKIYARDGSLLYKIFRNQNRTIIKYEEIPRQVIDATIAVEDRNFWTHSGFSPRGIIRAFKRNIEIDDLSQGGSTITQQLVKNALLTSEKTYIRKLKELVLAIEVELVFSKEEILQMYFNEIPYGGVAYGIAEAAQTYFGKSVAQLNLAEAALLAGIPTAPTKYSPFGAHPEFAIQRQHHALNRMVEDGYITPQQSLEAKKTKIVLRPQHAEIKSPHFVMYVKDILVEKYGTRMVEEGGLEVYTSLDPQIQEMAEQEVREEIERLFPMRVTNGAALVTKPQTGEILAMVGSRDYFDTQRDGNVNVTTRLRQPGSSIKPLTYALALQSGYTPISTILDEPVSFPDGNQRYTPVNYDGQFHGRVTLKTALGSSFNIPAVKLLNTLGVNNLIDFAQKLGISTWEDRSRFGLSLTLGGGEVRMTEMNIVYGVFANQGMKVKLNPILEVRDSRGNVLEDFYCNPGQSLLSKETQPNIFCQPESVLNPSVAFQITDMLSDNNARIPAFGPSSLLKIDDYQVAVKTGTTNDRRDNWAIGYTSDYVVSVWVGNNDNSPMSSVTSGVTGATPIWHKIMKNALDQSTTNRPFAPPSGLIAVEICGENYLLNCRMCPNPRVEYFIPGTQPKDACQDKQFIEEKEEKEEKQPQSQSFDHLERDLTPQNLLETLRERRRPTKPRQD
jgi:1A family penicillin-binding protein